jgi:hypothetical protein
MRGGYARPPTPFTLDHVKKPGEAIAAAVLVVLLAGCSSPEPAPTVTVTAQAAPAPTVTVTVTPEPVTAPVNPSPSGIDLTTDEGLCAADAEMTNLELNDALALVLGYPGDRDLRSPVQDDAIRDYKNTAFERACPARAS